jgi:hypothetical protein
MAKYERQEGLWGYIKMDFRETGYKEIRPRWVRAHTAVCGADGYAK